LQNSGISSLAITSASPSPAGPTRKRFALKGRSAQFDARTDAVRRDLADVRLADRVFAPHYAAPMLRVVREAADLRAGSPADAEVLAQLAPGDSFEVLELAGDYAWGVAPGVKLVGYVPAVALDEVAQ
jgi:hypothetical protein